MTSSPRILVLGSPSDAVGALSRQLVSAGIDVRSEDAAARWPGEGSGAQEPDRDGAADRSEAAVLVVGRPGGGREGAGAELVLALARWERQLREGIERVQGLPTYVLVGESTTSAGAEALGGGLVMWLRDLGWPVEVRRAPPASGPREAHPSAASDTRAADEGATYLLEQHRRLYDELAAVSGQHDRFRFRPAYEESPWTSDLLARERETMLYWHSLEWLAGAEASRISGLTAPAKSGLGRQYPLDATADTAAYHAWLRGRGESPYLGLEPGIVRAATSPPPGAEAPLFSVVVPCHRPPLWAFERCISSVLRQSHPSFELCLCDDGSDDPELTAGLRAAAEADRRVKTTRLEVSQGISAATNRALERATGTYVVFLDHDDELAPDALESVAQAVTAYEAAHNEPPDLLYSDEDKIDGSGHRVLPSFKPGWSPDLLLSTAYLCHVLVVRRDLMIASGGLRTLFDGAQDYDLMLRVTDASDRVVHVPEVLYHWRVLPGSAAGDPLAKPWALEAGRRALEEAVRRRRIDASVTPDDVVVGTHHVARRPSGRRLVSALVAYRDAGAGLVGCYRSFLEGAGYDRFELILVDNGSTLPETRAIVTELARDRRVRVLEAAGPSDLATVNNRAAREAKGDLLLFLSQDIAARSPGWLAALVSQAEREEVGAVGCRLLYPDGRLQHAGIAVGVCQGAGWVQQGLPGSAPGYLALARLTRDCSAVDGACLMTRRSVFRHLGGFEENLPGALYDVDYCLRLRQEGHLVVYTPLAVLARGESTMLGHMDGLGDLECFRSRWDVTLRSGDPYYNPNLSRFNAHYALPTAEETGAPGGWPRSLEDASTG